jgi:hypothetical protein
MHQTLIQWFQWALFILPWFLLVFLDKRKVRRFMPVTLLAIVLVVFFTQLGSNMGWFFATPTIVAFTDISARTYGFFAVGTLFIFYFTFGRFWIYVLTNLILDSFQTIIVRPFFIKLGLEKAGSWNNWQILALMTFIAILLYLYQIWQDDVMQKWKVN